MSFFQNFRFIQINPNHRATSGNWDITGSRPQGGPRCLVLEILLRATGQVCLVIEALHEAKKHAFFVFFWLRKGKDIALVMEDDGGVLWISYTVLCLFLFGEFPACIVFIAYCHSRCSGARYFRVLFADCIPVLLNDFYVECLVSSMTWLRQDWQAEEI